MPPAKRTVQDDGNSSVNSGGRAAAATTTNNNNSSSSSKTQGKQPAYNGATTSWSEANGQPAKNNLESTDDADPAAGERRGLDWQSMPLEVLTTYRWVHRLPTGPPWYDPLHAAVLTNKYGGGGGVSIGRRSPTAVAHARRRRAVKKEEEKGRKGTKKEGKDGWKKKKKKQKGSMDNSGGAPSSRTPTVTALPGPAWRSKSELAAVVRRHFNAMPAEETLAAVELMYKVRSEDQGFRMRFVQRKGAGFTTAMATTNNAAVSGGDAS